MTVTAMFRYVCPGIFSVSSVGIVAELSVLPPGLLGLTTIMYFTLLPAACGFSLGAGPSLLLQ